MSGCCFLYRIIDGYHGEKVAQKMEKGRIVRGNLSGTSDNTRPAPGGTTGDVIQLLSCAYYFDSFWNELICMGVSFSEPSDFGQTEYDDCASQVVRRTVEPLR